MVDFFIAYPAKKHDIKADRNEPDKKRALRRKYIFEMNLISMVMAVLKPFFKDSKNVKIKIRNDFN